MIRILSIPGRSPAARRARLERVVAWMGTRGWQLGDYAEETGTALFERPADASPLPRLDATRWLPGPQALRPGQWLATVRADPRLAVLPGGLLVVAVVLAAGLLGRSAFDAEALQRAASSEGWYVVTADQLNVRAKPALGSPIVGVLYREQRVLVEGEVDADWVRVGIPEHGYVARSYLKPARAPPDADR